jgi:hypothetical protein
MTEIIFLPSHVAIRPALPGDFQPIASVVNISYADEDPSVRRDLDTADCIAGVEVRGIVFRSRVETPKCLDYDANPYLPRLSDRLPLSLCF